MELRRSTHGICEFGADMSKPDIASFRHTHTANLPTNIMDFRGFDSSIIFILGGGILMSIGDFPESLSQAILVGVTLVGGLGVG